jgi:hypothetical protein
MNYLLTGRQYLLQAHIHGNQSSQAFDDVEDFLASLREWNPIAVRWHRSEIRPLFSIVDELPERLKIAADPRPRNGLLNSVHLRLGYKT